MIHPPPLVLAVLFLAGVGLWLIIGTTVYLDGHPRFAKRLGWTPRGGSHEPDSGARSPYRQNC